MTRSTVLDLALGWTLLLATACVTAAQDIESRPLHFAKGASSATLKGSLTGDRTIDYTLRAQAGQTVRVELKTGHPANFFNVLPPGSRDVAVFVGSRDGQLWAGVLPADGEYTIRVYLLRSAARRKETAHYTLTVGTSGTAAAPVHLGVAPAGDARVKGTPYHAIGQVACSMGNAAPDSSRCEFGVIRGAPGHAEVHLRPPGQARRVLTFAGGRVSAGEGASVKLRRAADDWLVDVNGQEHYRIPDAVINRG